MSEDPENFLENESLVDRLIVMLGDTGKQVEGESFKKIEEKIESEEELDDTDFLTTSPYHSTASGIAKGSFVKQLIADTKKFTFVRQLETDPNVRIQTRREVEFLANNFRARGNNSFKLEKFKEAIDFYTKGLECIPDTPVLYCSRGISYVKLANYKRALMDFDFVINRLDKKCLRAWLCRAGCFLRLNDEKNYKKSIDFARQYNMNEREYIEKFVERLPTEF